MVWLTADTHFGHENIVRLCGRPFSSVDEMNSTIVERWNDVVAENDDVYHLGDFAYRCDPSRALEIALSLNGVKHLVPGGHDMGRSGRMLNGAFEVLPPLTTLNVYGIPIIVMCHYPLSSWWNRSRGSIMLHGHSHGKIPLKRRRVDVGVDSWEFRPVSLDEVCARGAA
jgi:calcineurin-like phosphoesterase family protein